jgi:hypothetical protein
VGAIFDQTEAVGDDVNQVDAYFLFSFRRWHAQQLAVRADVFVAVVASFSLPGLALPLCRATRSCSRQPRPAARRGASTWASPWPSAPRSCSPMPSSTKYRACA